MKDRITSPAPSRPGPGSGSQRLGCHGLSTPGARRVIFASVPDARSSDAGALASQLPPAQPSARTLLASGLHPLLTIEQVAELLNVSPKTVRRLRIPCIRLGRLLRFRASDVERFLAARSFHA